MQKLHFTITIDAPVQTVWDTMLNDATYRQWTKAFHEGSYYKGSWDEGSKMLFLGPDPQTGKEGGIVARIKENRPHQFISIEHVGLLSGGVEDTTSDEVKRWTPAFENYTFEDLGGQTKLTIDVDSIEEYAEMFADVWPRALHALKELAEKQ